MPTYNQLAATSLLNQQYNAALGLGTVYNITISVAVFHLYLPLFSFFPPPFSSCLGLHGIPVRGAPMVEQAVQTVPLTSAAQKRGKTSPQPQNRYPVRPIQRSGRDGSQLQKENLPTSRQT